MTGIARGVRDVRWLAASFAIAFIACFLLLAGCAANSGQPGSASAAKQVDVKSEAAQEAAESSSATDGSSPSYTGGWGILSDDTIDEFMEKLEEIESAVMDELEDRETAVPTHARIGEEIKVTDKLAVSVMSVEPGPYDYADQTPTMKVTVAMRNLTDKTILVKPSNWDADNTAGQRVDHKRYVKDEAGKRDTRSFLPARVSPRATFTGVLYFDGEGLVSVVYEPHWLVSSENQYVYFDVE